jgi:uncharacterized protein (TIGR02246 family)
MKANQFSALAVCLLLVVGCQSATKSRTHERPRAPQQEEELRQASAEWDKLYNAGNAANLAALYDENTISMPPNSPTLQGRKALQADFESFFAGNIARHQTVVDKIVMDRDLAIEAAHYRLTFRPRAGGAEMIESGRHLECRRFIDGKWRIVLEIWNSETPLPK